MPKILIVDDEKQWHEEWCGELPDSVEVIHAYTIDEARALFAQHPDVPAIVMDACVPGSEPITTLLIGEIRRTYKGPILAVSSLPEYRKILVAAGCDYDVSKPKMLFKLLEVLHLG